METPEWDKEIINRVSNPLINSFYISVNDGTHINNESHATHAEWEGRDIQSELGCCFPILTRSAYQDLGFFMPNEINMWGADIALYKIFLRHPEKIIRIPEIKVLHHSWHNGSREKDETASALEKIANKSSLTNQEIERYSERLS